MVRKTAKSAFLLPLYEELEECVHLQSVRILTRSKDAGQIRCERRKLKRERERERERERAGVWCLSKEFALASPIRYLRVFCPREDDDDG